MVLDVKVTGPLAWESKIAGAWSSSLGPWVLEPKVLGPVLPKPKVLG